MSPHFLEMLLNAASFGHDRHSVMWHLNFHLGSVKGFSCMVCSLQQIDRTVHALACCEPQSKVTVMEQQCLPPLHASSASWC